MFYRPLRFRLKLQSLTWLEHTKKQHYTRTVKAYVGQKAFRGFQKNYLSSRTNDESSVNRWILQSVLCLKISKYLQKSSNIMNYILRTLQF